MIHMKTTSRFLTLLAALATVSLVTPALAVVNIGYVNVGNINNVADSTGYGSVAYNYKIAKNETTIGQYAEFLNAVAKSDPYALYNPNMASITHIAGISRSGSIGSYAYSVIGSSVNKPITYVSWFDAARFCNWMHNGQGGGSTETGAYTLNGAMSGIYTKNAGATTWIPSENEWYKAAYYDATKGGSGGLLAVSDAEQHAGRQHASEWPILRIIMTEITLALEVRISPGQRVDGCRGLWCEFG